MNRKEIENINNAKDFAKYNFYHYTSKENFIKIVKNKYFLMNSLKNMNDVNEANRYKNSDRMFALCFCNSNSENIPLWYLYAGIRGNGIRIGITPKNMLEFCKHIDIFKYNNENISKFPINKNEYEIMFGSVYYFNGTKAYYKNEWIKLDDINAKYFTKDYPWHYEREFRIFVYLKNEKDIPNKLAVKFDEKFCKNFRLMFAPETKEIGDIDIEKFYSAHHSNLKINMDLFKRNKDEIQKFCKGKKKNNKKHSDFVMCEQKR